MGTTNPRAAELERVWKRRRPGSGPNGWVSWIKSLGRVVQTWGEARRLSQSQIDFIRAGVLQSAFPAFLLLNGNHVRKAAAWVAHSWDDYLAQAAEIPLDPPPAGAMLSFELAVWDYLAGGHNNQEGQLVLRRLMTLLAVSQDELGRTFGVTGETIRRWDRGTVRIPDSRLADLISADAALSRLLTLFLPERLPQVLRRRADLFDGERALDLILRGRIAEVADRYEAALAYQA